MGMSGTHTNHGLARSQEAPLFVSVDEDASLVKDTIQKERRADLDPFQLDDINAAAAESLQADGQLGCRKRPIVRKRDQKVEVRARVLVASCERAIENCEPNAVLGPQRAAKAEEERPMSPEILALTRCKSHPPRFISGRA